MPHFGRTAFLAALGLVGGCQAATTRGRPAPATALVVVEAEEGWRAAAMPADAAVADELPPLFARLAAAQPRGRGAGGDIDLLSPNLRLPRAAPAPGAYRCRIVRLGAAAARGRGPAAQRPAFCFVGADTGQLSLTIETPARRIGGYLWDSADSRRLIFLGADFAPPARTAPAYGAVPSASTAGILERIGDFRYRLVVRGQAAGTIDAYELVAAPAAR
jgi:Domain of unknown function (DUF4893)